MVQGRTVEEIPVRAVLLPAYLCRLDSVLFGDETLVLPDWLLSSVDTKVQDYVRSYTKIKSSPETRSV